MNKTEDGRTPLNQAQPGIRESPVHELALQEKKLTRKERLRLFDETRRKMSAAKSGANNPNYGKPLSPETKLKLSAAIKGRHHSERTRKLLSEQRMGELNPNYGVIPSPETRLKKSIAARKSARRLENNPAWKGDAVGYGGLHYRMRSVIPPPDELHNISGTYPPMDKSDWMWLCRRCHSQIHAKSRDIIVSHTGGAIGMMGDAPEAALCGSCSRLNPVLGTCPYEPYAHSMMPVSECPVPEVQRVIDLSKNPVCPECGRHTRFSSRDPCEGDWFWCGFCSCGPIAGPRPGDILDRTQACTPENEGALRGVQ